MIQSKLQCANRQHGNFVETVIRRDEVAMRSLSEALRQCRRLLPDNGGDRRGSDASRSSRVGRRNEAFSKPYDAKGGKIVGVEVTTAKDRHGEIQDAIGRGAKVR
jgi:hypothetical protein